jgi:hypothetical protein
MMPKPNAVVVDPGAIGTTGGKSAYVPERPFLIS